MNVTLVSGWEVLCQLLPSASEPVGVRDGVRDSFGGLCSAPKGHERIAGANGPG